MTALANRTCTACKDGTPPLGADDVKRMLTELNDWTLSDDGTTISRRFEFKGFAKAVEMANLAAWLGNKQGHHPDVAFGWGYCLVSFTTHAAGGLTENDFICAARLDALVA
ncbi:4a-hydroxytetrahydrobiopterin dehydratase [Paracoccus aurantiacus]|uniref:Putative pterin-4-alpha-carbinolamine dehydratase n=1 Tax=Paracoccus aurantiacus TaxID=2599412 RepID=A0A5C6S5Y2_9RHOB|nr:4a-hydroxytetrahydrobiopterin dehydratase [Paracoccus aurantiacus]TXB69813.1 4a-hydroxytetrahydrobiopterin dehydratase [Paracoccus aurantiacus]